MEPKPTNVQRSILSSVILTDLHLRDAILALINDKVSRLDDFSWIKQIKYGWDKEVSGIVIM